MNNPGEYPEENQENELDDANEELLPAAPATFLSKPVRVGVQASYTPIVTSGNQARVHANQLNLAIHICRGAGAAEGASGTGAANRRPTPDVLGRLIAAETQQTWHGVEDGAEGMDTAKARPCVQATPFQ